jgi:hypothetical protein
MKGQSLESALNAARKLRQAQAEAQSPEIRKAAQEERKETNFLLAALQHSATGMDKIVQRRIGLNEEPTPSSA